MPPPLHPDAMLWEDKNQAVFSPSMPAIHEGRLSLAVVNQKSCLVFTIATVDPANDSCLSNAFRRQVF